MTYAYQILSYAYQMKPAVTQAEIAKRLGISQVTVSYALRGSEQVSEQTREKVLGLVAKVGYRPNSASRAMNRGRFDAVALLLHVGQVHLPVGLLQSVCRALHEHQLDLKVAETPDEDLTSEAKTPRILTELSVDGLLIDFSPSDQEKTVGLIRRYNLPAIWVNDKLPHDCIYPDDERAAHDATARLIALGHRRIAYCHFGFVRSRGAAHYSEADRLAGYERAMRAAGLPPRVEKTARAFSSMLAGAPDDDRLTLLRALLGGADRPTAVVAYDTTTANPLTVAALTLGLRLPADLSVVSFAAGPVLDQAAAMQLWEIPMWSVGWNAVELLRRKIERPTERLSPLAVPFESVLGATAAPCA